MVMHTCNPRLHPEQLIYIINHAEDRVLLFDATFASLIKGIAPHCPNSRSLDLPQRRDQQARGQGFPRTFAATKT